MLLHLLRAAVYQERERIAPEDAGTQHPGSPAAPSSLDASAPAFSGSCKCPAAGSSLPPLGGIRSFVFQHPDDFPEVVDFIHAADKQ